MNETRPSTDDRHPDEFASFSASEIGVDAAPEAGEPVPAGEDPASLHRDANERLARLSNQEPVSFGRQMLQLVLIPALIVAGVMGVWLLLVTLAGSEQNLEALLTRLESVPAGGTGSFIERPGHQERARAAVTLMGWLDDAEKLSAEDRQMLVERLPQIARLYQGQPDELPKYLMGSLGILGQPQFVPLFEQMLTSEVESDIAAALVGLTMWQGDRRPLAPLKTHLVKALGLPNATIRTLAAMVLAGVADPSDQVVRDALARSMGETTGEFREAAWNAGAALAALGDDRGVPVLLSLMDRDWLAGLPEDASRSDSRQMSGPSQDKVIGTAINVAVRWNPRTQEHEVRIHDPEVWAQIERLAESDPSADVRELARKALEVRASSGQNETDSGELGEGQEG